MTAQMNASTTPPDESDGAQLDSRVGAWAKIADSPAERSRRIKRVIGRSITSPSRRSRTSARRTRRAVAVHVPETDPAQLQETVTNFKVVEFAGAEGVALARGPHLGMPLETQSAA